MNRIAQSASISPLADLETSTRGTVLTIENDCMVDAFVKIKMVGGSGHVTIRRGSCINSGTVIYSGNGVEIGPYALIAANCTLAPVNHCYQSRGELIVNQRFLPSKGGIVIGRDVWIGAGCVILDGAHIPEGVVIGAMSLVREQLEPYGIYSGNPLQLKGFRE